MPYRRLRREPKGLNDRRHGVRLVHDVSFATGAPLVPGYRRVMVQTAGKHTSVSVCLNVDDPNQFTVSGIEYTVITSEPVEEGG